MKKYKHVSLFLIFLWGIAILLYGKKNTEMLFVVILFQAHAMYLSSTKFSCFQIVDGFITKIRTFIAAINQVKIYTAAVDL
jgi:hypothetical protein